jgi:hypothetical protein
LIGADELATGLDVEFLLHLIGADEWATGLDVEFLFNI